MISLKEKPTILGQKIILRPFDVEKDFPYIEECMQDPVVIKYTGSSDDYNREEVYEWYRTRKDQADRLDLAIVDQSTKIMVGEVVVNLFDETRNSMNFRILIGPRGRDKGLGTEATQLIVDYIFKETSLKELTLSVFAFNPRAKRVYEKIGFVIESIDENELEYDGKWIDSINMSLTREDWEKRRNY
ncbi:diamine N-acetyltransferase [Ornithinibacillus halophilus]|uniref:Diamine N-acetyltransferase n=1 Tax=Ornithinibacillus halophilus TaxID=930117 RepID=A0A1M5JXD3_9BACI|nr:diamine N-acetyltransferase [Ornithinibacillus halophilus]